MNNKGLVFSSRSYIGSAEPPPTVLEDESRFGNDGAFLADGEPNWVRNEKGIWVLDFDGANDNITVPDAPSFYLVSAFSIECWIKPVAAGWAGLVMKDTGGAGGREWGCWLTDANKLYLEVGTDGDNLGVTIASTTTLSVVGDTWYHALCRFNGTNIDVFLNGSLDATSVAFSGPLFNTATDIEIAARAGGAFYTGLIGKVRIYNYALPAEEIAAIYQSEKHWYGK